MTRILWAFLPLTDAEPISAVLANGGDGVQRYDDIAQAVDGDFDACVAVIPGIDVALAALCVPKGTAVQMQAAARLMLEDVVAGNDTEFTIAVSSDVFDDDARWVAHFDASLCQEVLSRLLTYGLDPDVIVPAAALLPNPIEGSLRAPYFGVDIARAKTRGFAAEPAVMDYILEAEQPCQRLNEATFQSHFLQSADTAPGLNLRVGTLSKTDASRFSFRWLRRAAVLLAIAAVLWPALSLVDAIKYERAARQVDLQAMERVRQALPNAPRIVNARAQLRERMSALGLRGGPEQLLAHLARAIQGQPGTTAESIVHAPGQGLTATLIIADQNRLDQLVSALQSAGVSAKAQAIRASRNGPRADLTIKAKP